jgi:predicted transcriptional regulator
MPRWTDVLVEIYYAMEQYRYCQKLTREVKGSLTYLREIIKILEKHDLIEVVPTSKIKRIYLTERGKRVTLLILQIRSELKCL